MTTLTSTSPVSFTTVLGIIESKLRGLATNDHGWLYANDVAYDAVGLRNPADELMTQREAFGVAFNLGICLAISIINDPLTPSRSEVSRLVAYAQNEVAQMQAGRARCKQLTEDGELRKKRAEARQNARQAGKHA